MASGFATALVCFGSAEFGVGILALGAFRAEVPTPIELRSWSAIATLFRSARGC
jgi:hypothetical protein